MISSNKQQTSAFLNVASFLVRDELCAFLTHFSTTMIQLVQLKSEPD